MDVRRRTVLIMSLIVLAEYIIGGFVTFDDPSNAGFSLTSYSLTWPAVLPFIHRATALFMIAVWLIGSLYLKGTRAFRYSHITIGLMLIQSVIGAMIPTTLNSPTINDYVIIAHFSMSALIIIAAGFTFFQAWISVGQPSPTVRNTPSRQ